MIPNKLLNYWKSLQPREKSLLKIAAILIVTVLLGLHAYKSILLIDYKNRELEIAKNNFQYVFDKASNSSKYIKSQNSFNSFLLIDNFLISEAKANNLVSFNLKEENGKNALVFSSPSIENTVKFLDMITINQSLSVTSMTIKPQQGIFNFTIYFDIAK